MTQVFRLEHEEWRCGPYSDHLLEDWDRDRMESARAEHLYVGPFGSDGENHPSAREDGIEDFDSWHYFAFASEESLRDWFPEPFLAEVSEIGYVINEYEVDEQYVLRGRSQVCFEREHATITNTHCASAA